MATILLLGSGAREHALAWKLVQSPLVTRLCAAPGNPGIARHAELMSCDIENPNDVADLAETICADLVVVGPEAPLAAGIVDELERRGVLAFGPRQEAARLEWDKEFSKEFMIRHGIPTARFETFDASRIEDARQYLRSSSIPVVLKATGLAAGKGVVVANSHEEALAALESMLSGDAFGEAGSRVVIEEYMAGEEASVFAITDGERYLLLAPSQDHKRIGDDDIGPNTGGMGAYAPAPIVDDEMMEKIEREIVRPTIDGMRTEGNPYRGVLYVGVMIEDGAARVVEFNSRFGDPEAQVILPLLEEDLAGIMFDVARGSLQQSGRARSTGTAVCVVMSSEGYPGSYRKGDTIEGIDRAESRQGIVVFQAGTKSDGDAIVTNGGRVLGVTAIGGDDLERTIERAYEALADVTFAGAYHRTDIGRKGMKEEGMRDEG